VYLTKFTHSCVRLDDGDRALVIDPGVFSEVDEAIDGTGGVLITHEHPDHVHVDKIRAALRANTRLQVWAPNSVTALLDGFGEQVTAVAPGESFEAVGFPVRTSGGQHALIHAAIPVVANVGYLVADTVFHPGHSFTVPEAPVPVLLLPTSAPWSKVAEVIDYAISVRAPHTYQIHDALVTDNYTTIVEGHLGRLTAPHGVEFRHLAPRETVDLD